MNGEVDDENDSNPLFVIVPDSHKDPVDVTLIVALGDTVIDAVVQTDDDTLPD